VYGDIGGDDTTVDDEVNDDDIYFNRLQQL
jgi:hypothetical protein